MFRTLFAPEEYRLKRFIDYEISTVGLQLLTFADENMGGKMKPQSAQRKTLCSQKEFPFKDKTDEQGISCSTEAHKNGVKGFGINT